MIIFFNVGASGDVSVKEFCQGDVTNSICVQGAADAAKGNRLYFAAGSYHFQNVKISTGTEVFLDDGVIINFPKDESIGNYNSYFLIEDAENISFIGNGAILEGQVSDYSVVSRGFYITGGKNIQIDGFKMNNFHTDTKDRKHNPDGSDWGAGVLIKNTKNLRITNNEFRKHQYGIKAVNVNGGLISGNKTASSERDGILVLGRLLENGSYLDNNIIVSSNTVEDYTTSGEHGRAGIHFYGAKGVTVMNNIVKNPYAMEEGDLQWKPHTITDPNSEGYNLNNKLTYDTEGIRFRNVVDFWCEGNNVENHTTNASIGIVTIENDLSFVKAERIDDSGDGVIINNTIKNGAVVGIAHHNYQRGKAIQVIGNTIDGIRKGNSDSFAEEPRYQADGIEVNVSGSKIMHNKVYNTAGNGIYTTRADDLLISSNEIINVGYGETVNDTSWASKVGIITNGINNIVRDNTITDNQAEKTLRVGISTSSSSTNFFDNNEISNHIIAKYPVWNPGGIFMPEDLNSPTEGLYKGSFDVISNTNSINHSDSTDDIGILVYRLSRAEGTNAPGEFKDMITYSTANFGASNTDGLSTITGDFIYVDNQLNNNLNYWYNLKIYDNNGNLREIGYDVIDSSLPSIKITSQKENDNLFGSTELKAEASDPSGIAKVSFYLNNTFIYCINGVIYDSENNTFTCNVNWEKLNIKDGQYNLIAIATDASKEARQGRDELKVMFGDYSPPIVNITSPDEGAILTKDTKLIIAEASDPSGIAKISFYFNNKFIYCKGGASFDSKINAYSCRIEWTKTRMEAGGYKLIAVATDSSGQQNIGRDEIDITIE